MSSLQTMILTTMTTTMSEKNAALFLGSVNFKESAGNPFEGMDFEFFFRYNVRLICNVETDHQNLRLTKWPLYDHFWHNIEPIKF